MHIQYIIYIIYTVLGHRFDLTVIADKNAQTAAEFAPWKLSKHSSYHARIAQAIPGRSHLQPRKPVLPPHPGHSDLRSSSALLQPVGVLVLIWLLHLWWMRGCQESTGRSTELWTKKKARGKKRERRTDREGGREKQRGTTQKKCKSPLYESWF